MKTKVTPRKARATQGKEKKARRKTKYLKISWRTSNQKRKNCTRSKKVIVKETKVMKGKALIKSVMKMV